MNEIQMKNLILQDSISFPDVDLKNVKAVLIDLDDTLYSYKPAHDSAIQVIHDIFLPFRKMSLQNFKKQIDDVWAAIYEEMGSVPIAHNRMIVFQRLAEKNKIERPYLLAERLYHAYFNAFFKALRQQGPALQAKNFLKKCKKQKIPVCLVTDMQALVQTQKLKALKLTSYVDLMVSNDEAGFDKPNPQIFLQALKKLNLKKKDVIMIGNDMQRDIEGAKKLGISSYRVIVHK